MKKTVLLSLTILITLCLNAQLKTTEKADVNWGEELRFKKGEGFVEYLGKDKNSYFLVKSIKKGNTIASFNKNLSQKNEVEIDMKNADKKQMIYEGSYLINQSIFVFSSLPNKKTKVNSLYCRAINKDNLEAEKLIKIEEFPFEKKRSKGNFGVEVSADESTFLVLLNKPYQKNAAEKFGFTVLDNNLEEMWKKEIELPYTEQFFTLKDYQLNNDGDVYLLGKEYKENKKDRIKGKPNYKYHILAYLDKGRKVKDYEINLEDKFITNITYKIAKNGDLICSGFYSENDDYSVKGAFFMTIDFETRRIKNNSLKEFDEKFITQGWTDKAIAKAKKKEVKKGKAIEMYKYDLGDFILKEDGGAMLIAEQYYMTVTTYTTTDSNGNRHTHYVYHYHYNDIIVINISPKGKIIWATKVEKYQHSTNDHGYYSSYVLKMDKDKLHLIYNENAKSYFEKEKQKELSKKDKKSYLSVIVTVNQDGEQEKEILINASENNTYPVPKLSGQIDEDDILIYTRKKKTRKFAIVHFK